MDKDAVIRQLRAWADGIDPTTGETLPADHPAQRADRLRVLYGALALLDASPSMRRPAFGGVGRNAGVDAAKRGPAMVGGRGFALAEAFDAGANIGAMATTFGHTRRDHRVAGEARQDRPDGLDGALCIRAHRRVGGNPRDAGWS